MEIKSEYLFVDDILETDIATIDREFLESKRISQRGKVISGTFGAFNINEFEKASRRV